VTVEHSLGVNSLKKVPFLAEILSSEELVSNVADEQVGHQSHHHRKGTEGEELSFSFMVNLFGVSDVMMLVVVRIFDGGR